MQNLALGGFCAPHWEQAVTERLSRPASIRATVRCITCERRLPAD
jgi:hypothetical protein